MSATREAARRFPYLHTQRHTASLRRRDGHSLDGIPGDCQRAATATLLREPDDLALPHFVMAGENRWWPTMRRWARRRHGLDFAVAWQQPEPETGHDCEPYELQEWGRFWAEEFGGAILGGPSPRGPFGHAVVGTIDGEVLWDPHPTRAGLLRVTSAIVVVPALLLAGREPQQLALPAGAAA